MAPSTRLTALLAVVIAGALGAMAGIGGYTFVYAKGASYLGNDPNACANCHIMQDHLDGWIKSSHRVGRDLQRLPHAAGVRAQSISPKPSTAFFIRSRSPRATFTTRSRSRNAAGASRKTPAANVIRTSSTTSIPANDATTTPCPAFAATRVSAI